MAYTRNTENGGLQGKIVINTAGKYEWKLMEWYRFAEIVGKTGNFSGKTILSGGEADDYDTAAAALKTAFQAAE
jgi:hypothetical protein